MSVANALRLRFLRERMAASFWPIPLGMVAGAVLLAWLAISGSKTLDGALRETYTVLLGAGADGGREMIGVVAGSIIGVAGVTFSITMVVLTMAASQYTPRILRTFMKDRTNKVVIGGLLGIFTFCLLVLTAIQGGDDEFIPALGVLGTLFFGLLGLVLVLYFIQHVTDSIQATTIVNSLTVETKKVIDRVFPDERGPPPRRDPPEALPKVDGRWRTVRADRFGYVQGVDLGGLAKVAAKARGIVAVSARAGAFVADGSILARLSPGAERSEDLEGEIVACFSIGRVRTVEEDVCYGTRQIVDIALKALSTSVNDPTTATICVDHLGAVVGHAATKPDPGPAIYEGGALRVIVERPVTFEELLRAAFEPIFHYGKDHPLVTERVVDVLRELAERCPRNRVAAIRPLLSLS